MVAEDGGLDACAFAEGVVPTFDCRGARDLGGAEAASSFLRCLKNSSMSSFAFLRPERVRDQSRMMLTKELSTHPASLSATQLFSVSPYPLHFTKYAYSPFVKVKRIRKRDVIRRVMEGEKRMKHAPA